MDEKKVVIELDNVKRDFLVGDETVHALRGVSFKIYEGEFVTIMGKSGSGKSTLLNQLGCLDTPLCATIELPSMVHTLFLAFATSTIFILPTVSFCGVKRSAFDGTESTPLRSAV